MAAVATKLTVCLLGCDALCAACTWVVTAVFSWLLVTALASAVRRPTTWFWPMVVVLAYIAPIDPGVMVTAPVWLLTEVTAPGNSSSTQLDSTVGSDPLRM